MEKWTSLLDKSLGSKFATVASKVKGVVYSYSEYQMKVEQATNNEKWGANSTLMQDISQATNNIEHFHEIMDMIYKKFEEKDGNWRQCYKALQLLDYLMKHGSSRVVENAREHTYDLKALLKFRYIDEKGKDQGVNVQARAKQILELIEDPDTIEQERQKARENRGKYAGYSSEEYHDSPFNSSPSGNFGSEGYGSSQRQFQSSSQRDNSSSNKRLSRPNESPNQYISQGQTTNTSALAPEPKQTNLIDMSVDDDWGDFSTVSAQPAVTNPVSNGIVVSLFP